MSDADLLRAYRETTWTVTLPSGAVRVRIGEPAPVALAGTGIITAYNPRSEPRSGSKNIAANLALRRELEARGARLYPSTAGEGKWEEPGFAAVGLTRDGLAEIGARFEQNAIVWIDPAGVPVLVATRSGFCGYGTGESIA